MQSLHWRRFWSKLHAAEAAVHEELRQDVAYTSNDNLSDSSNAQARVRQISMPGRLLCQCHLRAAQLSSAGERRPQRHDQANKVHHGAVQSQLSVTSRKRRHPDSNESIRACREGGLKGGSSVEGSADSSEKLAIARSSHDKRLQCTRDLPPKPPNADPSEENAAAQEGGENTTTCHAELVPGPFAGVHVYAVPLGEVTTSLVAIWQDRLTPYGASVSRELDPVKTTHVVVDPKLLDNKIMLQLLSRVPKGAKLLSPEWIVQSLKSLRRGTKLLELDRFLICLNGSSPQRPNANGPTGEVPPNEPAKVDGKPVIPEPVSEAAAAPKPGEDNRQQRPVPGGADADRDGGGESDGDVEVLGQLDWLKPHTAGLLLQPSTGRRAHRATFACQKTGTSSIQNFNAEISEPLEELSEIYGILKDLWRHYSYKKAATVIKTLQFKVASRDDVRGLRGVGSKMADKVQEILDRGSLDRLACLKSEPKIVALRAFANIHGVGPTTAGTLWARGFRSIEDLRTPAGLAVLSDHKQRVGLNRYEDLLQRIPRAEVGEIEATVTGAALRIMPGLQVMVCGSYRRGKPSCGDVDVIIAPPPHVEDCDIMGQLLAALHNMEFLTDDLAVPGRHQTGHSDTYMGVCKLPGPGRLHRRLDIKVYPRSQFAFALLYFTGSDHFNRSMRLFAKKRGLTLSDQGLAQVVRHHGNKLCKGESVKCFSEREVFEALSLEYKEPWERNVYDVVFVEEDMKKDNVRVPRQAA